MVGNAWFIRHFCRVNHEYIIKPSQEETTADGALNVLRLQQTTSLRQAARSGIRAFQGIFPRLNTAFNIRKMENVRWL